MVTQNIELLRNIAKTKMTTFLTSHREVICPKVKTPFYDFQIDLCTGVLCRDCG